MQYLKTNTAVIIAVGPFLDKTDGVTLETGLTITNERITLVAETDAGSAPTIILDNVTGATTGTANDLNYITGQDNGMMQMELAQADVNRLGRMRLTITDAANHCPVIHDFVVLPAQVYDSLVLGSDLLDANASQIGGTAATLAGLGILDSGTAAAIANGTITLRSGHGLSGLSSALVILTGGTAAVGKSRIIAFVSGDQFSVDPAWNANGESTPSGTITYVVMPAPPAPTTTTNLPTALLSVGTGTGQVNLASGKVPATLAAGDLATDSVTAAAVKADAVTKIAAPTVALLPAALGADGFIKASLWGAMGTALTETAGQIAAAITKFFNKANPTGTVNSLPDAVAGATGGVAIVGSAMTLTSGERTAIADALLGRNQKGASTGPAGQTVADALAGGGFLFSIAAGVITVKNLDGTTAFTRTLTRAAADAIASAL